MSTKDTIEGRDVGGDRWEALKGKDRRGVESVAEIIPYSAGGAWLDAKDAARLATFLLFAAGPYAAREALAKLAPGHELGECDACQVTTLLTPTGKAGAVSICAPCLETSYQEHTASMAEQMAALDARASIAERRLAAVLALTSDDVEHAVREGEHHAEQDSNVRDKPIWRSDLRKAGADAVLNLIRSRATEGAEAPTGATT